MKSLRELRELADISQITVANRSGVSRMKLSLIETGQTTATAKEDRAIRRVLVGVLRKRRDRLDALLAQASSQSATESVAVSA
jgi:transcriptional regulator with XRE-family HTH domain